MASSGTVTLLTESVDYPDYSRGSVTLTNVIGWTVNNSGVISFTSISSSDNAGGTWGICGVASWYGVTLEAQVSYNGGSTWNTITSAFQAVDICPSTTNTISTSVSLIGSLGTAQLTGDCMLRFLYYANAAPAPTADLPVAFPDSGYSAAVQVPVNVDVSWTATVKYNANGGTGAPSDTTATSSASTQTLTLSATAPTRENYRFEGWATSSSATTAQYQPGGTITISKSTPTVTLYAVWTEYYRPGAIQSTNWLSHNRSSGNARVYGGSNWIEMRTIDAPTGKGNPPSIYHDSSWFNQQKLGKES